MKNNRRRKFTTYKFFVEGQVGKVFLRPQKEWKNGFWLWHIGFAVGKSNRKVNDWYYLTTTNIQDPIDTKRMVVPLFYSQDIVNWQYKPLFTSV